MSNHSAIVLLSGGLDSTVALADTLSRMLVACVLTMDYAQRSVSQELKATKAITQHYQVPHQIITLPWLADLLPQALQQAEGSLESQTQLSPEALMDVHRVWVPNRNGLFLNIAASFAEAMNADTIVFGANAEEGVDFPDNTVAFRHAVNQSLSYSTLSGVQVEAPMETFTKAEIIQRGIQLNVPFQFMWSCYENREQQCGQCPSCLRIKAAQEQVGVRHLI